MRIKALLVAALLLLPAAGMAADPADTELNAEDAKAAAIVVESDPAFAPLLGQCPADGFRSQRPFWAALLPARPLGKQYCQAHPGECLSSCTGWHNGGACFDLAQALQYQADIMPNRVAERLYAMACANGMAAGCVNRAAGIRNMRYEGDAFVSESLAAKESCEYRSFTLGCAERDARGCAMLGQAYAKGEGIAAHAGQARRYYERSCAIA